MEILGIGPTEFLFIIIILLLVLGPTDLVQLGRKIGGMIRKMRRSETWLMVSNLARALRELPNTLADEAGTDEIFREVMPDRYRKPTGSISMKNTRDVTPNANTVRPPESDAYQAWTKAVPPQEEIPEQESEPDAVTPPETGKAEDE